MTKHVSLRHTKSPKLVRGTTSRSSSKLRSPNVQSGFDDLDEETLLSLSVDAPVRLTPPPEDNHVIPESSPTSLSNMRLSNDVMEATLDRLGFGPHDDLSNRPIPPALTPTPINPMAGTAQTLGHEEKAPTAEKAFSTEASGTDHSDEYGQIIGLFQQIAQRTGDSVSSLILEWALLHARTNMMERRVANGHGSNAKTMRQLSFEQEVNNAIELGTGLADEDIEFMFIMVGQSETEDTSLSKFWCTPGLQGMFRDLSLSDEEILAAARMCSYSSMWSRFCNKYRQGQPLVGGDDKTAAGITRADKTAAGIARADKTAAGIARADISSFIETQSASAASAFLGTPRKKGGLRSITKESLPSVSEGGISSPSSLSPSSSSSFNVTKPIKNERSALSVLQDVLLGCD